MKKKLSTRLLSLFLSLLMIVTIIPAGTITAQAASFKMENAISWALEIANNNYYGYHYGARHGAHWCRDSWCNNEDFDCSSFVATALRQAGINISMFSTGNMNTFKNNGFVYIAGTNNLQRGDILWRNGHVGIYLGNNQVVHAMYNYNEAKGGNGGGQWRYGTWRTGEDEIRVDTLNWFGSITGAYRYTKDDIPPAAPLATTPSVSANANNIAVGKSVHISWSAQNAAKYDFEITYPNGRKANESTTWTSKDITLSETGTYSFCVKAYNKDNKPTAWSNSVRVTTHEPKTITFVDWDDTPLGTQTVRYGESAVAPNSPSRKGYSFQGWNDSFYNVTSDKTIKATYKINTYTVNFRDINGDIIKSEKVKYGNDAVVPTDTNEPDGYKFIGWDSEKYKNVYTEESNKTININGIYSWHNDNLPVLCTDVTAERQPDGYYVNFNLINYNKKITRGRAVVSLKTASGKLVDMTESAAFSLPIDTNSSNKKAMEVFIPSDSAASSVEVIIVSSYSSGVPISEKVTATIGQDLMWSKWSPERPTDENLDIETRTEYRFRDKETATGNTKTKDGWTYTGERNESVGNWSGWDWNWIGSYDTESQKREVQKQSAVKSYNYEHRYNYYRWAKDWSGGYSSKTQTSDHPKYYTYYFVDYPLGWNSKGYFNWYYNGSNYCALYAADPYETWVQTSANYADQYRYRDTNYIYNFYRWKPWSEWQANEVSATNNREVETRTAYRYKSASAGIEDDSGKIYTQSGKVDSSFAGKQITLYVYGYTGASDYTNQYIGQSVVGDDGSYSFEFKLREEPTVKTGDFTVAIGLEGTSNTMIVNTILAPKPTYTVKFFDWEGNIVSTQTVIKGENAVLPENPEKEGYNFIGWDKSNINITEDTEIYADFAKKQYTVVFVDWGNKQLEVKKFEHGDVLTVPDYAAVEGYTFDGWDQIKDGNIVVTKDMVVTADYLINTYTVKFYDFDGNVVSTQEIEYGSDAEAPENIGESEDGKQFAGWFNPEEYENVDHDVAIYPSYYFEETTAVPTANYESGEYSDKIELTLTSKDENAVIFYYINGDESTEKIYTEPVTVDKTCSVTYYATSFGKNDSEAGTEYYCINSGDKPSEWMLYSELPDEVTENVDDYVIESETGYKFKDIQQSSERTEIAELESNGWELEKTEYTEYTSWQDEPISIDDSLIGFEVDTQVVSAGTSKPDCYKYSRYKYIDNGTVKYSNVQVDGFECEYEELIISDDLSIKGFTDDGIGYYQIDSQEGIWLKKERMKTKYRSRYQIAEYYKWTAWGVDAPSSAEKREYETETVYRYANKTYHIVTVVDGFCYLPSSSFIQDGKKLILADYDDMTGYNLEGLYKNIEFTDEFDAYAPITESVTLYAKYTPKKYTVTFQMKGGTELDTQVVEYLQSATAPATDVVPGYVFGGWDKEFDCITEDTVITGKYFKESEYTRVTLNKEYLTLFDGTTAELTATISPSNLTGEELEWTSSDNSVATVDNNGKVTAVSQGEAIITCMAVKTKETATCKVTVTSDLTSSIVLKSDSALNYDSLGYLRRVALETSSETVSKQFANKGLRYFDINNTELLDTDFVGTGTEIRLYNGEALVDKKTVVITGDMTGDGIINNRDVAMMNKLLVQKVTASECQELAIDVNGDGYVNNRDAAMVARYLVGKDNF